MKRSLPLILGILMLLQLPVYSQLRVAVVGGPLKANVLESNQLPGWDSITKPGYGSRNSFNLGVIVDIPLGISNRWFLQPGIIYHGKGRNYYKAFDTSAAAMTDTFSLNQEFHPNYIDIPFNLTYKFPLGKKAVFMLSAGPYVSMFYNGKQTSETRLYPSNKFESRSRDIEVGNEISKVKTLDLGLNARAGFEIGKLLITGFYSRGLTSFYQAGYTADFKHEVIGASFGFYLNKRSSSKAETIKDQDKDGIPDSEDECPTLPGSAFNKGCPDKDGDGTSDNKDQCPGQPGLVKYNGCPVPDSDQDGVNDENDKCPHTLGDIQFDGCPAPDSDSDGIDDIKDKCPQEKGSIENNGCPRVTKEAEKEITRKIDIAARQILFETGSDKLLRSSMSAIEEVVSVMKENATLTLEIAGHTDNIGDSVANKELSQRRADAVKVVIEKLGIENNRIQAIGYGETVPVTSNETPEGRSRNRRVELKIENH